METIAQSYSVVPQKRAHALDALRGLAILAMSLSGLIPFQVLPTWMYHAQEPPPTHIFNPNLPGLTWVDVVFPFFLFSLGAAIPLAISSRIQKGWSTVEIVLSIFKRGLRLGVFAIFLQHVRPFTLNPEPTAQTPEVWWIALLGFFLMFFIFVRWPESWNCGKYNRLVTLCACLVAVILLATLHYPDLDPAEMRFSLGRSDIILVLLTNLAVFGSLIWLMTKSNVWLRLGFMGLLLAMRLSACHGGAPCASDHSWIADLWDSSPVPWIFKFEYLHYLFLVIPGTIAGDLILAWSQTPETDDDSKVPRSNFRLYSTIALMLAICLTLLVGLQSRAIWQTTLLSAILCLDGYILFISPKNNTERLLKSLYLWGIYWLALGLLFEPFEGGIKKDPPTMSYYFVTAGMAIFVLIAFTIIIDILKKQKRVQLLIDNGQNPMIAYVGFANFILPILVLIHLESWIVENTLRPDLGIIRGVAYTLLLAYVVRFFTKRKLFWRT